MSEFPYYKRYPANILADCRRLTAAEYGVYNFLLDTMWLQGGRLSFDKRELARIGGVDGRNWGKIWPRIESFFIISEDGKWISQKRMNQEIEEARELSERRRASGNARWEKPSRRVRKNAVTPSPSRVAHNPLENNEVGHANAYIRAYGVQPKPNIEDSNEAHSYGASLNPLANDLPTSASSAREAERHAAWLHKLAERNRPADPNHPTLVEAEAEQIDIYRRAKHLREKLKAAGFKGLRIIPP